jgi:hypothetical protein
MSVNIYNTIGVGDEVGVADAKHNLVLGPVKLADGSTMCVLAFGCLIPFARRNSNKTWVAVTGVKLVQHQPALELT